MRADVVQVTAAVLMFVGGALTATSQSSAIETVFGVLVMAFAVFTFVVAVRRVRRRRAAER